MKLRKNSVIFFFHIAFVCLSLFFALDLEASPPIEEKALVLGLVPEINIFEQRKRYKPILKYISEKIDTPVRMKIYDSYFKIIEGLKDGSADMAFVGSLDYVIASSVAKTEVLVRPEWEDGVSTYSGLIFTRKGSSLTIAPSTWKGKKMALVHEFTTAGDLFQRYYLAERGVLNPEKFLGEIYYEGSHDAVVMMVLKGEADIGGAKDLVFKRLARENKEVRENIVILAESERVPSNGLVVSPYIDEEMKKKLKDILLAMDKDDAGRSVLASFRARRFLDTDKEDYNAVYGMMESLGKTGRDYFDKYAKKELR
ncbi:MAG: phosphate/phosphite/phosphonate ABC transporter substrate-binding protein [bacterium]|nr:phosphate/phosphite/phosphonate ABC transporter substrate-binding protein [bacterium]